MLNYPRQLLNDSSVPVVSTSGPIPQAGDVIPQMFITFQGNDNVPFLSSDIYIRTSTLSNATVNFTLTAEPSDVSVTKSVNTTVNIIMAVGLPDTQMTTLGVTFIPGDSPSRFDLEWITLVVANASLTSSYLPSPSLPASSSPPIFTTTPSPSSTEATASSSEKVTIIGATLGSALGVLLIVVLFLVVALFRRRRQCAKET
ncbi:hypothetical protein ID866_4188, partial [Astraeus odoratus]